MAAISHNQYTTESTCLTDRGLMRFRKNNFLEKLLSYLIAFCDDSQNSKESVQFFIQTINITTIVLIEINVIIMCIIYDVKLSNKNV